MRCQRFTPPIDQLGESLRFDQIIVVLEEEVVCVDSTGCPSGTGSCKGLEALVQRIFSTAKT